MLEILREDEGWCLNVYFFKWMFCFLALLIVWLQERGWLWVTEKALPPSSHDSSLAAQSQSHTEQGRIFSNQMERPKKMKEKAILSRKLILKIYCLQNVSFSAYFYYNASLIPWTLSSLAWLSVATNRPVTSHSRVYIASRFLRISPRLWTLHKSRNISGLSPRTNWPYHRAEYTRPVLPAEVFVTQFGTSIIIRATVC